MATKDTVRPVTEDGKASQFVHSLAARAWRRAMRRPVGRLLHAARRRAALRRVAALRDALESVLVVCQGNICRSPYAAGASPTVEVLVGLTTVGWDPSTGLGLPGAVFVRPMP